MVPVLEALETALSIFVASWLALAAAVACMAMATGSHLVSAEQFCEMPGRIESTVNGC